MTGDPTVNATMPDATASQSPATNLWRSVGREREEFM